MDYMIRAAKNKVKELRGFMSDQGIKGGSHADRADSFFNVLMPLQESAPKVADYLLQAERILDGLELVLSEDRRQYRIAVRVYGLAMQHRDRDYSRFMVPDLADALDILQELIVDIIGGAV